MSHLQVEHLRYPHRINPDGTVDSICPRCFVTIGTSNSESELERMEAEHDCNAERRDYLEELVRGAGKSDGAGAADASIEDDAEKSR
jgi:hypothetical protein